MRTYTKWACEELNLGPHAYQAENATKSNADNASASNSCTGSRPRATVGESAPNLTYLADQNGARASVFEAGHP